MKFSTLSLVIIILALQACGVKPSDVIPKDKTDFPREYPSQL